jgi:hypothetical protein
MVVRVVVVVPGTTALSNRGTPHCTSVCGCRRRHRFVAATSIKGECRGQEEPRCFVSLSYHEFASEEASGTIF